MRKLRGCVRACRAALFAGALTGLGTLAARADLTIDLRLVEVDGVAATSAKSAEVTHYGQTFTFDLFATVTNPGHQSEVDFKSLQGSFRSDNEAASYAALGTITPAGATLGGPNPLTLVALAPFADNGAQNGLSQDLNPTDGDLDLGDNNASDMEGTLGFVAMRAGDTVPPTITPDSTLVTDGRQWRVGRIEFTVGSSTDRFGADSKLALNAGNTDIAFLIRRDLNNAVVQQAALWAETADQSGVKDGSNASSIVFGAPVVLSRQEQWNIDGGGSWAAAGNWAGTMPDGVGAVARFLKTVQTGSGPVSIDLDGNHTVGQIIFDNAISHTIAPGTGGTLTLDNGDQPGQINVGNGTHTISAPIAIPAGKAVNRTGSGSLVISGTQTHGANAVFNALGGTTQFDSSAGTNLTLNVGDGTNPAIVKFNANQALGGLNIKDNAQAGIQGKGTALDVNGLTLTPSATMDIGEGTLFVHYTDADHGISKFNALRDLASQSLLGSDQFWAGPGLTSSFAKNDPRTTDGILLIGIGFFINDDGSGEPWVDNYRGHPVDSHTIVAKATYFGDSDLDGKITGDDIAAATTGWFDQMQGIEPTWLTGDYDYDGRVTADDFALQTTAWFGQDRANPLAAGAGILPAGPSAVPEPATFALFSLGALGLLARRRRAV